MLIPRKFSRGYTDEVPDLALPLNVQELRQAAQQHMDEELWASLSTHAFCVDRYSPNSLRSYRAALELLLRFLRHDTTEQNFAFAHYKRWLQQQGFASSTVDKRLAQTRLLLTELCGYSPQLLSISRSSLDELNSVPYTDAEIEQLLLHSLPEERIIIVLALEAALTVKEISQLERGDVQLEERVLLLRTPNHVPDGEPLRVGDSVSISPFLLAELQRWFALTPSRTQVVANTSQTYINAAVRQACARAGIPARGLRSLRVTAGARAYRESGSLQVVMSRLRLKTVQQAQAYARATADLQSELGQ